MRWLGRCGSCRAWGSIVEAPAAEALPPPSEAARPVPLCSVVPHAHDFLSTGLAELDRVLGGGLVPGSVTLVGGEPGTGKSTLVLEALGAMARSGARCLLVSAEESAPQVRARAERLGVIAPGSAAGAGEEGLWLGSGPSMDALAQAACELRPDVLAVDSVQTIACSEVPSPAGSVAQVSECAGRLVGLAKSGVAFEGGGPSKAGPAVLLVGHVTKDGSLAGPRALEHLVDTVLSFEGDRHQSLRLLRAAKHRFGPTGELGLFAMTGKGLEGVDDPSAVLLADRRPGVPGAVVVPVLEGHRVLLVEVQALVAGGTAGQPRRSAQGVDQRRLALVLAVLEQRLGMSMAGCDVFVSAVGGVRVAEPAADVAIALALVSAAAGVALPAGLVACGEVGLAGEIRQVPALDRRLAEAARLGFAETVVPASCKDLVHGLSVLRAGTLVAAVEALGLPAPPRAGAGSWARPPSAGCLAAGGGGAPLHLLGGRRPGWRPRR